MSQVVSPLTGGGATKLYSVKIADIVSAYKDRFNTDVASHLPGTDELDVYECADTGYAFFWPLGLDGPPSFYEDLYAGSGSDWGYQDTKWEFSTGMRLVAKAQSLLDVGCGGGDFLAIAKNTISSVRGLETSAYGLKRCAEKDIEALPQRISEHAANAENRYDAVTSFQVLEHVSDPRSFLAGCVDALKPGGILLLSVPNNDSFLKDCGVLPLNCPPHHVGLWSRKPLEALTDIFPLVLERVETEPLSPENFNWYQAAMEAKYLPASRLARSIYYRFGGAAFFRRFIEAQSDNINGHTMIAQYRKS